MLQLCVLARVCLEQFALFVQDRRVVVCQQRVQRVEVWSGVDCEQVVDGLAPVPTTSAATANAAAV